MGRRCWKADFASTHSFLLLTKKPHKVVRSPLLKGFKWLNKDPLFCCVSDRSRCPLRSLCLHGLTGVCKLVLNRCLFMPYGFFIVGLFRLPAWIPVCFSPEYQKRLLLLFLAQIMLRFYLYSFIYALTLFLKGFEVGFENP